MPAKRIAKPATRSPRGAFVLAVSALVVIGLLAWHAASLFWQDLIFTAAQTEVSFWGRGNYRPNERTRDHVGNQLDRLLGQAPSHPGYLGLAAHFYAWRAYWDEAPASAVYAWRAVRTQAVAMESRPAHRQGWVKMIGYATPLEGAGQQLSVAEERLAALAAMSGPNRLADPVAK